MRRFAGICAVVAVIVLVVPSPSPAQTASRTTQQLTLIRQTAFVGPEGIFTAELSTGDLPAGTTLDLVLYGAVTTRARLDRTIAGEQLGTALFTTPRTMISGAQSPVILSLPLKEQWPAPEGGTVLSQTGVYPVVIEAIAANGTRLDSLVTHLLRLPSPATPTTPLAVAATVVIDAPFGVALDGTPSYSDAQLSEAAEKFRVLSAATSLPFTLAATPSLVQALTESGDSSARPDSSARQTLSRPYVTVDSGSLQAAGSGSLLKQEVATGDAVLSAIFEASPDRQTLVLSPSVTPSALDQLSDPQTRSVVLQSSQIRSSLVSNEGSVLTNKFVIESANLTPFSAMANDDRTSARFLLTNNSVLGAHHALTEVMMLHGEQPGPNRGVVVTIPSGTTSAALKEFLAGLGAINGSLSGSAGAAALQPVTLNDLFTRVGVATTSQTPVLRKWTSEEPKDLGQYGASVEQAQWNLLGLTMLLPDGGDLTNPIERTVLASAQSALTSTERLSVLANADSQLRLLTAGITLPESQKVTLTSRSGKIPLVVTNSLPVDAVVQLKVSSPKLTFPEGTTYEVVLPPASTTRTDISVTTKASGAFPLDVQVYSTGGVLLVNTSRIDVRSTAISGFGLFLSLGAGVFLLVWWARNFRHSRRAQFLEPSEKTSLTANE
ncbi:MAG: DUF6049 family protein [Acidimicrobiales bacterium]